MPQEILDRTLLNHLGSHTPDPEIVARFLRVGANPKQTTGVSDAYGQWSPRSLLYVALLPHHVAVERGLEDLLLPTNSTTKVAQLLYRAGARLIESDYTSLPQIARHADHWANIVRYAEPRPALEQYVRSVPVPSGYYATTIDRLLRLGVSPEAFPPGEVTQYRATEPGRWWALRTGPPLLPLGRDLARYVWAAV